MASTLVLGFVFFTIVTIVLIASIIMIYFWVKGLIIKRKAPKFEGELQDFTQLNYDQSTIERRALRKQNGNIKGGFRSPKEEIREFGGGEGSDEEEIRSIKERIARAERELREARE